MSKEIVLNTKDSANVRKHPRNACFLRGEAEIGKSGRIPCEIHDIAHNSARIVLDPKVYVPNRFILSIPRRHVKEWVRVVRRSEKDFGVVFENFHF